MTGSKINRLIESEAHKKVDITNVQNEIKMIEGKP